jgi:(p)ppGpp synthase/HD superfamily hydrolase
MKPLSERFDEALEFASRIHRDQTRKATDIPYVGHLLSVAGLVLENGGDEVQAIAALLHDSIEDQSEQFGGGTALGAELEKRFGTEVRSIVEACSDSPGGEKGPWRARKEAYVARLRSKGPRVALVSLADKVHNARSIVADLRQTGPTMFERFSGGRDGTLWYYRALATEFAAAYPCFLAEELDRTVAEMELLGRTAP